VGTLIVNLTRFGDVLQSQPLVAGLIAQGEDVSYLCLDNFRGAAELLDGPQGLHPLPGGRLLAGLDAGWPKALSEVLGFSRGVAAAAAPDTVLNITPALSARLLTRLLGPQSGAGLGLEAHGFARDETPWAAYLQTASRFRGASPFNLVDVFCRVGGIAPGARDYRLKKPAADVDGLLALPAGARRLVGFQLGASEERRRWPLAHFASVARGLWENCAALPVILGARAERPLAERLVAAAGVPVLDLAGRTNLSELAAVTARLDLLLTNDTGTMHLAAGLGTPILAVFLCTAQPWDTGPYLPGALCLEPDLPCHPCAFGTACAHGLACRAAVVPEVVLALAQGFLQRGAWPEVNRNGARLWLTGREESGLMGLTPFAGTPADDRYQWLSLLRRMLGQFLDGSLPREASEPGSHPAAAPRLRAVIDEAVGLCTLLAAQGELLSRLPLPAHKTRFLATWQRLGALLAAEPRLAVIGALLVHEAEERGAELAAMLAVVARYARLLAGLGAALC